MTAGYDKRLVAFAEKSPLFTPMRIVERRADGTVVSSYGEAIGVRVKGYETCDCCGNKKLKLRFPLQAEDGAVYLIGSDCHKNLEEMGRFTPRTLDRPEYTLQKDG